MSHQWIGASRRRLPRSFRVGRRRTVIASLIWLVGFVLLYRSYYGAPKGKSSSRTLEYVETSFDWSNLSPRFPRSPDEMAPLPTGKPRPMPPVQYDFRKYPAAGAGAGASTLALRRHTVKQAFQKCWNSYRQQAWTWDELKPVTGGGKNTFGGLAATLVDALDTLWIMDMKEEFYDAVEAVATRDFSNTTDTGLNLFETTIRHLGGLLSAYDLSGAPVLLRKATELGDMLYVAFDTPNHLPPFWFTFTDARAGTQTAGTHDASAAMCSLSLEFTRLAQLTGNSKYYSAIDRVTNFLVETQNTTHLPGMWPTMIDYSHQKADDFHFTLGALADSLYEYLLKMHALLGGLEPKYEQLYRQAIAVVEEHLLFRPMLPDSKDILFSGSVTVLKAGGVVRLIPEGQHLSCFVGGMFGLGGRLFGIDRHIDIGERLAHGCAWGYSVFPVGIMPEIFTMVPCKSGEECKWDESRWEAAKTKKSEGLPLGFVEARDTRYILRPEAIESLFLMYRITGNPEYQELAWTMFESIRKVTETEMAFSAVSDVTVKDPPKMDSMESFWMAETLKYLYLIFCPPDVISLDKYVFNTEAHPFKRP